MIVAPIVLSIILQFRTIVDVGFLLPNPPYSAASRFLSDVLLNGFLK
jgi:hypothetical protein